MSKNNQPAQAMDGKTAEEHTQSANSTKEKDSSTYTRILYLCDETGCGGRPIITLNAEMDANLKKSTKKEISGFVDDAMGWIASLF